MDGPPVVVSASKAYQRLFALNMKPFPPNPDDISSALTAKVLLHNIEPYIKKEHFEKLLKDQRRINEQIIFNDSMAIADVPLQFTAEHPDSAFKSKVLLPCVMAKRVVGEPKRPHVMYLLVIFIENFFRSQNLIANHRLFRFSIH